MQNKLSIFTQFLIVIFIMISLCTSSIGQPYIKEMNGDFKIKNWYLPEDIT